MLRYKKVRIKDPMSASVKWYLRTVSTEMVDIDGLAAHMASHNTPYSKGAIKGIITDMVSCIRELAMDGKSVKLPDLAIFSLGISTVGTSTAKELTPAYIRRAYLNARGTGEFRTNLLTDAVSLREVEYYTKADAEGKE